MTTMITFQDQKSSDIKNLLVEEKVYGPAVVNSVMSGRNYIWGKRRISLIVEAMEVHLSYSLLMVVYFLNYLIKSTNLLL